MSVQPNTIEVNKPSRSNVTVLGAAGGIGQPLSLLLKQSTLIDKLNLFDVAPTAGIAMDLSHINTIPQVNHFHGTEKLHESLVGADIVVIVAGVTMKPGQTRDDLLAINAGIIKALIEEVAVTCPRALIAIVSNPVNSNVPLASEIMKQHGVYDERKIFGVTALDLMRAATFAAKISGNDPLEQKVPCIGGHSGHTIIPVISQATPAVSLNQTQLENYIMDVQTAGHRVLDAKDGKGTATLSMAYAAFTFTNTLLKAISGEPDVIGNAFVRSDVTEARYFSSRVHIAKEGVIKNYGLGTLTNYEKELVEKAIPELIENIEKGEDLARSFKKQSSPTGKCL